MGALDMVVRSMTTTIGEISKAFMDYRDALRLAKKSPLVLTYAYRAADRLTVLVTLDACYFSEFREDSRNG